jgi:hypothetical protein
MCKRCAKRFRNWAARSGGSNTCRCQQTCWQRNKGDVSRWSSFWKRACSASQKLLQSQITDEVRGKS